MRYTGYPLAYKWDSFLTHARVTSPIPIPDLVKQTENLFLRNITQNGIEPRLGFFELFMDLKERGLSTGLVSTSNRYITDTVLQLLKLKDDVFDATLCINEVKSPPPAKDLYSVLCTRLNVRSFEVLAFDDSIPGTHSAHRLGVDMVIIWDALDPQYKYPADFQLFVPDFTALAGNLDTDFDDIYNQYTGEEAPEDSA